MTAASGTPRGISRIREKITELPLYHSGVLSKKYPAEQVILYSGVRNRF